MWLLGAVTEVATVAPCDVYGWAFLNEYVETEAGARTSSRTGHARLARLPAAVCVLGSAFSTLHCCAV